MDGDTALPYYLSRHIKLGFDSDDVAALIGSIDSSQNRGSSPRTLRLPHLPAEILFHILEYVPAEYILPWRLVCRGFRDSMDGPVLFEHLKRTELIAYLGSAFDLPLCKLKEKHYDELYLLRARFERIEDTSASDAGAKWSGTHAIFRIDDQWLERCTLADKQFQKEEYTKLSWEAVLEKLQAPRLEERWGALRWCIRLDKGVLDLDFPVNALQGSLDVDLASKRVMIKWRDLILRFLKTETQLRSLIEEKRDGPFTFGHQEDCLRAVRRRRLHAALNLDNKVDRRINWEMNLLRPLFGHHRYDKASSQFFCLEQTEDEAVSILSTLRREATLSSREVAHLKKIAEDRSKIEVELTAMESLFGKWKVKVSGTDEAPRRTFRLPRLPRNPLTWSDEIRTREEERVMQWKSQEQTTAQLALLMKGSIEAMSLPEDVFDELGSDF